MKKIKLYLLLGIIFFFSNCRTKNKIDSFESQNNCKTKAIKSTNAKTKFDLTQIDSLVIYSSDKEKEDYIEVKKMNHNNLLTESSLTTRDKNERFLNFDISVFKEKKYKFIFFSKDTNRVFNVYDLDIEDYNTYLENGEQVSFPTLSKSKINGVETNGNFDF